MSLLDGILSRFMPTRKGVYVCGCKEVQFSVNLPPSSYGIIKQPCLACHCSDCVGFADKLYQDATAENKNKSTIDVIDRSTRSVEVVNCYTSDYEITKGRQFIKKCRLRESSDATRFYCSKCRTPLGLESNVMSFLYPMLFHQTSSLDIGSTSSFMASLPSYIPSVAVFFKDAPEGTKKRNDIVTRHGPIAPMFLVRVISRLILGLVLGNGKTGGMTPLLTNEPLPIGMPGQQQQPLGPKKEKKS